MTNLKDFVIGFIIGVVAQIGTFFQLQGPLKWLSWNKYYWLLVIFSIPLGMLYMATTKYMVAAFGGQIWPGRLMGFSIGAVVFTVLSWMVFKEPLTIKTIICLIMAIGIVAIQIFWK